MPRTARRYVAVVCGCGLICAVIAGMEWHAAAYDRLLFFIVSAILMSGMKIVLPRLNGTLSLGFLCILVSIVELPFSHSVIVGCASTLIPITWGRKRRSTVAQTLFNTSAMALTVAVSSQFYQWTGSGGAGLWQGAALVATCALYFLLNTMLVTRVLSLIEGAPMITIWRECYFWTFPYYIVGACAAGLIGVLTRQYGWQVSVLAMPVVVLMFRAYSEYLGRLEEEQNQVTDIAALHLRTIEALALAIAAKDQNTHEHLRRVQVYTVEIGKALGLAGAELEAIRAAALLHDIGKLAVPEQILSKPGKLRADEFEKVKMHPLVGAEILEEVDFPYPVAPIVRAHHEKFDGTGYPHGLKGDEIPLGARILSAVDCFDALASDRPYRAALSMEQAMEKIAEQSGTSFDPAVVKVLRARFREFETLSLQPRAARQLSTNVSVSRGGAPATGLEHVPEVGHLRSIALAAREFRMLFDMAQEAGKSLDLNETFSVLAERIEPMVPYDSLILYVCRDNFAIAEYAAGLRTDLLNTARVPFGEGVCGWVAENGAPVVNRRGGSLKNPEAPEWSQGSLSEAESILALPLFGIGGTTVAVLAAYRTVPEAFTADHLRILTAVTDGAGPAIANALKYRELEGTATTDHLTGLPNSRDLLAHMESELARARRFAVLMCDLDGFKSVNDRFGHLAGNRVLQLFARGMKECCGNYDYVARMGGDEFVVLFSGREDQLELLEEALENAAREAGKAVCSESILSVSVGHSFFPDHGLDVEALLTRADQHMYVRKQGRMDALRARGIPARAKLAVFPPPTEQSAATG